MHVQHSCPLQEALDLYTFFSDPRSKEVQMGAACPEYCGKTNLSAHKSFRPSDTHQEQLLFKKKSASKIIMIKKIQEIKVQYCLISLK